jgi:tetratricopeptide (TPR) repeat protein
LALAIIYTRQKRFDDAKARLQELLIDYPENYLVHLDIASVDLLAGRPDRAMRTYRDILSRNYSQLDRGVALTRLGVAARFVGDKQESERWLREAIQDSGASSGSRSVARVELGKTLDLEGQREGAVEQYRAALRAPDFLALHEDAERLIKKPYDQNALRQDNAAGGLVTLK